jgi:hypothetical protein
MLTSTGTIRIPFEELENFILDRYNATNVKLDLTTFEAPDKYNFRVKGKKVEDDFNDAKVSGEVNIWIDKADFWVWLEEFVTFVKGAETRYGVPKPVSKDVPPDVKTTHR